MNPPLCSLLLVLMTKKKVLHDPQWPCMTLNSPKTLLMDIFHDIMPCWTTLGPSGTMWASEKAPGWSNMAYSHVLCP